jgi:hypothetical protein
MVTRFKIVEILQRRRIYITQQIIDQINVLLVEREKVNSINIRLPGLRRDKEEALKEYIENGLGEDAEMFEFLSIIIPANEQERIDSIVRCRGMELGLLNLPHY